MDITKILEYEHYTPLYEDDPRDFLESVLDAGDYLTKKDKTAIFKAYDFARKSHGGVKRLSGEPYIVHPVKVVEFLMSVKPDVPSIQTALLHDVIEDTDVTYDDVKYHFGEEVAELCDGLEKVAKVRYKGEDRQVETLKKTFLAMGKDLRVIIIKMADRVHNIQTLEFHPKKEKQQRIAEETLKVFVPIAKRLGLYVYQGFLENGAFRILDPREYKRIRNYVVKTYGEIEQYKQTGMEHLEELCDEENLPYIDVSGRLKSPYRIYTKLQKYRTTDISKVMDILAFRVVTDSVPNCYNMLGVVHKHYTPIFSKMKDYIALPKPNGYKSLHTTILGMFEFPVEIQVRTEEMDQVANYGVAAHFAYAESSKAVSVSEKQAKWINKLQHIVQKYTDAEGAHPESFKKELNIEILDRNIFVYTPKGDIIELPAGCTVLDFAFRVHTDIGLKFKNAFINGRIVPIDHKLKTGDIVDIKTFKNKYTAARGWINFLHTPSAKAKLNRYVRQEDKESTNKLIRQSINERLSKLGLPLVGSKHDKITKKYKGDDLDLLFSRMRDKQMTPNKLIKEVYAEELNNLDKKIEKVKVKAKKKVESLASEVIVDEDKEMNYLLCPLCKPNSDDTIIAKSDKNGIKIHALRCDALETINFKKLMEAHRKGEKANNYVLKIHIVSPNTPGILLQVLKIFDFYGINISNIQTEYEGGEEKHIYIDLEFASPSKIYYLVKDLKTRKDLLKIVEQTIE